MAISISSFKVTGILDTLNLLQATASTSLATRPVFGDLEKTKNSPPYENLSTWSILQLSAITFADQYRIIKDLYQDVCVSSDALFEPIH